MEERSELNYTLGMTGVEIGVEQKCWNKVGLLNTKQASVSGPPSGPTLCLPAYA